MTTEGGRPSPSDRLDAAIDAQTGWMEGYRRGGEQMLFETLRALDNIYCRQLFVKGKLSSDDELYRCLSSYGVNGALERLMPRALGATRFRPFRSHERLQEQADEFLFHCGTLHLAERYRSFIREGVVSANLVAHELPDGDGVFEVLELSSTSPSHSDERIGAAGLRWASEQARSANMPAETDLGLRNRAMQRELEAHLRLRQGWYVESSTSPEIDLHFMEWAKVYLARMSAQDLIGADEVIGGRPYGHYVEVLTVISALSHRRLSSASILYGRDRRLDLRNMVTGHASYDEFVAQVARSLDGERAEIEGILDAITLSPDNLDLHVKAEATVWAPIVRPARDLVMLPAYGLDLNPFLFLLNDLRGRFKGDWFALANLRERRWAAELATMFEAPRWHVDVRNLTLRDGRVDVTDLDFVAFDVRDGELTLFQLKWQQPVAGDERARRSASKNLLTECNKWIEGVHFWLGKYGVRELLVRLGFPADGPEPKVRLAVLARYSAYFTGHGERDARATWSDWANFLKARSQGGPRRLSWTLDNLQRHVAKLQRTKRFETMTLPIDNLTIALNIERQAVS